MDLDHRRRAFRRLPASLLQAVGRLGQDLARVPQQSGSLLAVGTPTDEPWHLVAHLQQAADRSGRPALAPTLIRHRVPASAPAHLAVGLGRLARSGRGDTVLVVASDPVGEALLERLADVRRAGGTLLTMAAGQCGADLQDLCHDSASIDPPVFDSALHVLPLIAGGLWAPPAGPRFSPRRVWA